MAGIYIHIPFCKQACTYCNFHFSTTLKLKSRLVECIVDEIHMRKDFFSGEDIETLYFGGGTPSLLDRDELASIVGAINSNFNTTPGAEITLEANPDDITTEKLEIFKTHGINRLSIGTQSFFEEDLRFMNRAHSAREAYQCIELAMQAGIHDINIDLIYGTHSLTDEMWLENLKQVVALQVPHLSAYQLTVEKAVRQFELLMQWAEKSGFEHYEISNFSLPGRRSRHNTSYWSGKPYLGIGPAAHSFIENTRSWNIANNAIYMRKIAAHESPTEQTETLSIDDLYNEYIMTGLRRIEGIDLSTLQQFGEHYIELFENGIMEHLKNGEVELINDEVFKLTRSGKVFADRIASDCFSV